MAKIYRLIIRVLKKEALANLFKWCPEPDLSMDVNETESSDTAMDAVDFRIKSNGKPQF